MKIIIVEFPWQVDEIINKNFFSSDNAIISLNPESSYILKVNKIKYYENYQICNHNELWSKYKDINDCSLNMTQALDRTLWETDNRFRKTNWKLFNDFHFPFKMSFDQMFYYSNLISNLIKKFNPNEIVLADSDKIIIDDDLLINPKISILKYLVKTMEQQTQQINVTYMSNAKLKKNKSYNKIKIFLTEGLKIKIKNNLKKIIFLVNYYTSQPKYLAVGCLEVSRYKKLYPKDSKLFLSYDHQNLKNTKNLKNTVFFNKFIYNLKKNTNFYELIKYKNISSRLIFEQILVKFLKRLDLIFEEYNQATQIINKVKPNSVIFSTMTPSYLPNVVFRKTCIDKNIPFAVWMHGGYGLTYSISSYDVTDYRLCKNHISYGNYLKDLMKSDKCILKTLGYQKNQKILPVGSPRLDYDYKNKKKNIAKRDKPTILYMMGVQDIKNQFYFGRNRQKYATSVWEFQYNILSLLTKYQDKYNIIFKDYPKNGYKDLWKKVLKNINANKILYVSDSQKVKDLLNISDLNIVPWISTTFFESLYYDADIFVYEEDIFEKASEQVLKGEIFNFSDENSFIEELNKYLEKGNFYTCDKKNSKNYLLKLDDINKRDELLKSSLLQIN